MHKLTALQFDKIWGYELWLASTHKNGFQKDFFDLLQAEFPLLIKIIQANEKLSIQVHPNDEWATTLEGADYRGKTECWYVLDAKKDAKVIYGLKKDYSQKELKKAISQNTLEEFLNAVPVKKGDFIYIPAGTVHAICGGLRLLEVQQSSDITYRLYDWGRGRELHLQKALSVIDNKAPALIKPLEKSFVCDFFELEHFFVNNQKSIFIPDNHASSKAYKLLYIINSDNAQILSNNNSYPIKNEELWVLQPGETIQLTGNAELLLITAR